MIKEYLPIIVFFAIAVGLSCFIIMLPKLLARNIPQKAKLSSYECGFEPFGDARKKFEIRFYLVAILFIIFVTLISGAEAPAEIPIFFLLSNQDDCSVSS